MSARRDGREVDELRTNFEVPVKGSAVTRDNPMI
jgi:hypothetical protein